MIEELDSLLEKLSNACGVGYVTEAKEVVAREARRFTRQVEIDMAGNVLMRKKGKGKKEVMVCTHIDEIGFLISNIDESYLRFTRVGGFDPRVLPGQEVMVYGKERLHGYIGIRPPHYTTPEEREKVLGISDLYIDLGRSEADAKKLVRIGDFGSFFPKYTRLAGNLRSGKALDNRASVACGLLVLRELQRVEHDCNVNVVATTQEEDTGLGALTTAYRLEPDICLVIDVCHAEHPEIKEYDAHPLNQVRRSVRGQPCRRNFTRT